MKHNRWYPIRIADQISWLQNFVAKLAGHAPALGISTADCAARIADARWIIYVLGSWLPAVRKGQEIPNLPGTFLKSFLTLDGNGDAVFFSGKLKGSEVNGTNDTGIFGVGPDGLRLLVRKGMMVGNRKVKIVATLVGTAGSLAEGRWRAGQSIGVRLIFTDKSQALYLIPGTATDPDDWLLIAQTGQEFMPDLPGALLQKLNLSAYAAGATIFDSLAKIGTGTPAITKKDNGVVFEAEGVDMGGPITLRRLARRDAGGRRHFHRPGRLSNLHFRSSRGRHAPADREARRPRTGRWEVSAVCVGREARWHWLRRARVGAAGDQPWRRCDASEQSGAICRGQHGHATKGAARGYDENGPVPALVTFADRTQAVVTFQVP